MFSKWLGLELAYIDLGNHKGGSGHEIDADSWQFAGVAKWKVAEQFALYGKLGALATLYATSYDGICETN